MQQSELLLVCPICYGELTTNKGNFKCVGQHHYPIINNRFAAMMRDPKQALFEAALSLQDAQHKAHQRIQKATQLAQQGKRTLAMQRIIQADQQNSQVLQSLSTLLNKNGLDQTLISQVQSNRKSHFEFHFGYLARDWSGQTHYEVQLQHQIKALIPVLQEYKIDGEVLMPGAASARLCLEIVRKIPAINMHAVDISFSSVALYHLLRQEPIQFYTVNIRNIKNAENSANQYKIEMPAELKKVAQKLQYHWADFRCLPYKANSLNAVLSIYFTDLLPLPKLIEEAARVTKVGGYFLHYGPLTWHFNDLDLNYSLEEMIEIMQQHGFVLRKEETHALLDEPQKEYFLADRLSLEIGYLNFKNSLLLFQKA